MLYLGGPRAMAESSDAEIVSQFEHATNRVAKSIDGKPTGDAWRTRSGANRQGR